MFMNSALTRRHHPTSILPLRPALKERNIGDVERHLYEVSQPKSANCGKHWCSEGVVRTFAPSNGTAVLGWLIASGIGGGIALGRSRGCIQVNATVEEADSERPISINTEYSVYTHVSGEREID